MSPILSLVNPATYLPTEPIDDLLRSIRLSGSTHNCTHLSAPFGVEIEYEPDTLLFYEIAEGECTVRVAGLERELLVKAGDALVIPRNMKHGFFDPPNTPPINVRDLLARQVEPYVRDAAGMPVLGQLLQGTVVHGGGGRSFVMRMILMFADPQIPCAIVNDLPTAIVLPGFAHRHQAFLSAATAEMDRQRDASFMGQPIAIRLSEAILTMALREAAGIVADAALFKGLGDSAVARVISAVMRNPRREWDLDALASEAALSRSSLSAHFMAVLQQSPIEFVTHVRMTQASDMLKNSRLSIAAIAYEVAYGSEAAFNRAFRRWSGTTPGAFRSNPQAARAVAAVDC